MRRISTYVKIPAELCRDEEIYVFSFSMEFVQLIIVVIITATPNEVIFNTTFKKMC